ncbi:MAG: hypothetical protein CME36_19330 [unclassified Hahellaceae]|nr:hypothetical protein [Hahellaceae bacterium]|tara:strand:+ start:55018 stop:57093 length:2076 start_codon:yes stop_codon:yes gene_type:complete
MMETSVDFVFLRPDWLWCLLPILLLPLLRRQRLDASQWHRYLPAAVIERLLQGPATANAVSRSWWPTQLLLMLTIVALAGPSFVKQAVPVVQKKDAVVIVLDLSLSMYAEDQAPSRLARAKQKIHDLLALRQDGLTGLVVFAGSAHVVAPLTDDRETLRAMLPALDPSIMPEPGANPGLGLLEASHLIRQAGLDSGRILLLTDSIEASNLEALNALRAGLQPGVDVSVLTLGTASGGPISLPDRGFLKRGGEVIIARTDLAAAKDFASARTSDRIAEARFDDSDLRRLVPETAAISGATEAAEGEQMIEQRIDQGFWLLPLLAVLGLMLHRRGTLLAAVGPVLVALGSLFLTPALLALSSSEAAAQAPATESTPVQKPTPPEAPSLWDRLWQRDDQLAQDAYERGDYTTAAELYEAPAPRGAALYRAEDYKSAVESFSRAEPDPVTLFNMGNAHAYAGELEPALTAYDAALELDPTMTVAKENKAMIEALLKQQQEQQQQKQKQQQDKENGEQSPEQDDGQGEPNSEAGKNGQQQDGQPQSGEPQDDNGQGQPQRTDPEQGDQSQAGQQSDQGQDAEQQASAAQQQPESDEQPGDAEQQAEAEQTAGAAEDDAASATTPGEARNYDLSEQQQEQWLRRIPDDPGELLQRKFLYQYRNPDSRYDPRATRPDQNETGSASDRTSPGTASSNPW